MFVFREQEKRAWMVGRRCEEANRSQAAAPCCPQNSYQKLGREQPLEKGPPFPLKYRRKINTSPTKLVNTSCAPRPASTRFYGAAAVAMPFVYALVRRGGTNYSSFSDSPSVVVECLTADTLEYLTLSP